MLVLSGGKWKSRKFAQSVETRTRPTAIRAREGLFNVLEHRFGGFHEKRVADLYAGTGALGLEALSRGADHCLFIEQDAVAIKNLKKLTTGLECSAELLKGDARQLDETSEQFDLLMLDPPYGGSLVEETVRELLWKKWLKPDGMIVAEIDKKDAVPEFPELELVQDRSWGRNRFLFWQYSS